MNPRLRLLLDALSDAQAYRRVRPLPWILTLGGLLIVLGALAGSVYTLWLYWPTLLLANTFSSLSLWGFIYPALIWARLPLDAARLNGLYAPERFALALAVRRALAAGDTTIAPIAFATAEESEPQAFATAATPSAESLVVAIPDALMLLRAHAIMLYILAVLLLLTAAGGAALAPTFLDFPFDQLLSARAGQIYLVAVCGSLTFFALLCILSARRFSRRRRLQRRGVEVALDDLGLSFRQPVWKKRRRQIAWADMRGLGRYTYKDTYTREHNIYILTSEEQAFLWEEPPTERYASEPDQQRIARLQQAAWDLGAIVTRRTRLPIRDLSGAITLLTETAASSSSSTTAFSFLKDAYNAAIAERDVETATALWRLQRPHARRQPRALRKLAAAASTPASASLPPMDAPVIPVPPTTPAPVVRRSTQVSIFLAAAQKRRDDLLQLARALIPYYPTENAPTTPARFRRYLRRERRQRSLSVRLGLAMLLVLLVPLATWGVYWYDEQGMTRLLDAVPQQVVLQKPRYIATFISPQSDWGTQAPTKDNPTGAAFVDGAYQLSCTAKDSSAITWITQNEEGDIALSVSETIHGPFSKDNYAHGGLLFDVTDNGDVFSTFGVDEHGGWYLLRYNTFPDPNNPWSTIDTGANSAIRTGDNATNTLLLVRHGALYLLYVNNVLVDRYYDTDHALPPGGDMGVYIGSCDIVARFYDFLSYPVPPQLAAIPVAPSLPWWLRY